MHISVRRSDKKTKWTRVDGIGRSLKPLSGGFFVKIDYAFSLGGFVILTGWCSKDIELRIDDHELLERYDRIENQGSILEDLCGFLLIGDWTDNATSIDMFISTGENDYITTVQLDGDLSTAGQLLKEQLPRIDRIFPILCRSAPWRKLFGNLTTTACDKSVVATIEGVAAVSQLGLVVMGWVFGGPKTRYWLLSRNEWRSLDSAIRTNRADVADAYKDEPLANSGRKVGFYACLRGDYTEEDEVALLAVGPGMICIAGRQTATVTHEDPIRLSRLLFSIDSPLKDFSHRLAAHEGPLLDALLSQYSKDWSSDCEIDRQFGEIESDVDISIIIPLHTRWDFVEHQLAAFSTDPDFHGKVELIYVVDDPNIVDPLLNRLPFLYELYRVPLRLIWGGFNRGYAGANNFGAANASGATLLFVNSDVFPKDAGWASNLEWMLNHNPDYGVIAPKLLYPDCTIQHAGMAFEYEAELAIWINTHPLATLPVSADPSRGLIERPAVTGACMALRREDFWDVGGFDTGYLIGDFEDSDLCLKLRAAGKKIGYLSNMELTHLERQSFSHIGEGDYRQKVVIFNAWRHFNRWKEAIVELASDPTKTPHVVESE